MIVVPGNVARISTGELVKVTSAVDQEAPEVIENPDDLFLGYVLKYSPVSNKYFYPRDRKLVVNSMSSVVAIENNIVIE